MVLATTVNRTDAWTEREDLFLATSVLEHVKQGSTQLAAFDYAAEKLNRTPSACGFRWNSAVRHRYQDKLEEIRAERIRAKIKEGKKIGQSTIRTNEIKIDIDEKAPSLMEKLPKGNRLMLKSEADKQKSKVADEVKQVDVKAEVVVKKSDSEILDGQIAEHPLGIYGAFIDVLKGYSRLEIENEQYEVENQRLRAILEKNGIKY